MRFHLEQPLPASPDAAIDVLTDPTFLASLSALPRLGRPEVLEQRTSGDVVHQRVRYRFTGPLSPTVTRVLDPNRLVWVEETAYDRRALQATFRILPDHYGDRLRAGGTYRFAPADPGSCTRVVDGSLEVRFPLVGKAVERAIVSGLQDHMGDEAALVARWLEERRRTR